MRRLFCLFLNSVVNLTTFCLNLGWGSAWTTLELFLDSEVLSTSTLHPTEFIWEQISGSQANLRIQVEITTCELYLLYFAVTRFRLKIGYVTEILKPEYLVFLHFLSYLHPRVR
jgi:hypothetical protein